MTEERIWAEVQRRIALGPAGRTELAPVPDRRPLVLSVVLVAAALVVAGLLASQRPDPPEGLATATTIELPGTLDDLAAVAGNQPTRPLRPDQVIELTIDHLPTAAQRAAGVEGRRELHSMAGDGRGQLRTSSLPEAPGTVADDVDTYEQPGSMLVAGLTPDEIAALPGDPGALRAALDGAYSDDGDPLPAYLVLELLAVPIVPPDARAALFPILADLGAEVGGATADARGRPGVAVTVTGPGGERVEAVLDPATTALLSLRRDEPRFTAFDPAEAVYQDVVIQPDD